jgi:hypothetical protein
MAVGGYVPSARAADDSDVEDLNVDMDALVLDKQYDVIAALLPCVHTVSAVVLTKLAEHGFAKEAHAYLRHSFVDYNAALRQRRRVLFRKCVVAVVYVVLAAVLSVVLLKGAFFVPVLWYLRFLYRRGRKLAAVCTLVR